MIHGQYEMLSQVQHNKMAYFQATLNLFQGLIRKV